MVGAKILRILGSLLQSKMYSIRVNGQDFVNKAKGIRAGIVDKTIGFEDYVECLKNEQSQSRTQYMIKSRLHNVETVKQFKIELSPYDDKRFLLPQSTDTLAWGHYKIQEIKDVKMDVDREYIMCIYCTYCDNKNRMELVMTTL